MQASIIQTSLPCLLPSTHAQYLVCSSLEILRMRNYCLVVKALHYTIVMARLTNPTQFRLEISAGDKERSVAISDIVK